MLDSLTLPANYVIRPAIKSDRWMLQKLVLQLIWFEALGFDLRLISYRLIQILLLVVLISAEIWLVQCLSSVWQSLLVVVLLFTSLWAIALSLLLLLYIVLIPIEPLFNWSMYWVVECRHHPVACAALLHQNEFCVLYHVVVDQKWRGQKLASHLVQHVVRVTKMPLYLVCRPALVPFYRRFGFQSLAWKQLAKPLKAHFKDFVCDRHISRVNWEIMACSQDATMRHPSQ